MLFKAMRLYLSILITLLYDLRALSISPVSSYALARRLRAEMFVGSNWTM